MRIGVLPRERVFTARERVEQIAIQQIANGELVKLWIVREVRRQEQVLRHDERLVIRRIFLANTIVNLGRQKRLRAFEHAAQQRDSRSVAGQGGRVDQPDEVL